MLETAADPLRQTPLRAAHEAAGAQLVPFAGWEMPLQYEGIGAEHRAVRTAAGLFDVSHMGQVEVAGPDALALLQRLLSNDVARLAVGGAQYSLLCNEDGGVIDDLIAYRLEPYRYLLVTNAANHERDFAWMRAHAAGFEAELHDRLEDFAMLALQGPRARVLAAALTASELPDRLECAALELAGADVLACGTGYTGEDGLELLVAPADAVAVWEALVAAGASPAGLAARDTLRLEVCFHLHGAELSEDRDPIAAGLGWCCAEATGFLGAESVARARAEGPAEKLVAFELTGGGIARPGNPILGGGVVTSGTMSPSLGVGVGMAYVPAARTAPGTELEIDVRGRVRPAAVAAKPLYRRPEADDD